MHAPPLPPSVALLRAPLATQNQRPAAPAGALRGQRGPILRYYVPPEARDEHLAELITTGERVGVIEVSLLRLSIWVRRSPSKSIS